MPKKKIVLIGGGPACLMAADVLADQFDITIYEQGKTIGRKFLVAGKGGFNLTNSVEKKQLISHYTPHPILIEALKSFESNQTRAWLDEMGIPTYVGSSGRVFPLKEIKPAAVLAKIKSKLKKKGVKIEVNSTFIGFNTRHYPIIQQGATTIDLQADHVIFGLGGASWSKTGSNGKWTSYFEAIGIKPHPFESSNCGVNCNFSVDFTNRFAGTPLKNCALHIADYSAKGELLITTYGLEGNLIYPAIPHIRQQISDTEKALIYLDFKPNNTEESLLQKIENRTVPTKYYKSVFNLDAATLQLLKSGLDKEAYQDPQEVVRKLKMYPIQIQSLRPIEEAISTVGGISLEDLNPNFTLKKYPHLSVIGEMLNWDAPTGGFLLQGCFSTGYFASKALTKKL